MKKIITTLIIMLMLIGIQTLTYAYEGEYKQSQENGQGFELSVNGHDMEFVYSSGAYGNLYSDGEFIDRGVLWRFFSNGHYIYYTKNSNIYRFDLNTHDKVSILLENDTPFIEGIYGDKYLYYSSSKYSDVTLSLQDLIVYDLENSKEITYIDDVGTIELSEHYIFVEPCTGDLCPLDIRQFNLDGSDGKTIINDASAMKVIDNTLYYSAIKLSNWEDAYVRSKVKSYNINTGVISELTDEYARTVVVGFTPSYAVFQDIATLEKYIEYYNSPQIRVLLNGSELSFDQPPVMINDRVMVPIRAVAEKMGDAVKWSEKDNSALIIHPDRMVVFKNNYNSVIIAKEPEFNKWERYDLDVPAQIIGDRTLTPVRAIGECLGAEVEWDAETQTVNITSDKNVNKIITDETITKFNVYYSLMLKDNFFAEFSPEIREFYESRNGWSDAFIIWWDDWFIGIDNLISGEENNVYMLQNCLAEIFSELPDNKEINMSTEIEITNWLSTALSYLSYVDFTEIDKVANISPHTANALSKFGNALDKAGLKLELTGVTFETVCKILSDYTTGITYIDLIRETLKEENINDEVFYNALDNVEKEYTNKIVNALANGAKNGVIAVGTFVIGEVTGGAFTLASFSKDTLNAIAGNDDKADAVKNIHCIYWFNEYIDKAELSIKTDVYTKPEKIDDYIKIFNFQKIIKKKLYQSMDMLKNSKDEYTVNRIQEQLNKIDNMSYIIWR